MHELTGILAALSTLLFFQCSKYGWFSQVACTSCRRVIEVNSVNEKAEEQWVRNPTAMLEFLFVLLVNPYKVHIDMTTESLTMKKVAKY
jgi:hypothetical protein